METTENQANKNGRQRLTERFAKSNPDRKFEGDGADDELFAFTADELDRIDGENARYRESAKKVGDLFNRDDRAAGLVRAWGEGADPIMYLVENFGDDFVAAMESDSGKERFKEARDKWLESKAKEDERAKNEEEGDRQFLNNFGQSIDALKAFAESHNLDDDKASDLFLKLHSMVESALDGRYTEEMYEMAYSAGNHDRDVEVARREGEVKGRNEQIRRKLREGAAAGGKVPTLGGESKSSGDEEERKPKTLSMFGNIPAPGRRR